MVLEGVGSLGWLQKTQFGPDKRSIIQKLPLDKQFVRVFNAFVKNYEKFHWLLLVCNKRTDDDPQ